MQRVTTEQIDTEIRALETETEMFGKAGTGEIDLIAVMQTSEQVGMAIIKAMITQMGWAQTATERMHKSPPKEAPWITLMEDARLLKLPVLFFRLGYRLGLAAENARTESFTEKAS